MSILLQKREDVLILLLNSSWYFCACKCGFGALSAGHVRGTLSLSSLDSRGQVEPERTRLWNYADRVNWKKQVWTSRHVTLPPGHVCFSLSRSPGACVGQPLKGARQKTLPGMLCFHALIDLGNILLFVDLPSSVRGGWVASLTTAACPPLCACEPQLASYAWLVVDQVGLRMPLSSRCLSTTLTFRLNTSIPCK